MAGWYYLSMLMFITKSHFNILLTIEISRKLQKYNLMNKSKLITSS